MEIQTANPAPAEARATPPPAAMPAASGAFAPGFNPDRWVDDHGDYLMRYALARLRDSVRAEDFVQETFLAALKGRESFAGKSSERTWLTGILKNKIMDFYRRAGRETVFTDMEFLKDEFSEMYLQEGVFKDCWVHDLGPSEWKQCGESLDQAQFWKTFHLCAGKLPANIARVFLMREMDDVSSEEICKVLNITPNNLWVMLHRARMALRRCLEVHWFARDGA